MLRVLLFLQKILDFFKIDIEWSEYQSFEEMFKTDILNRIKQIGLELHFRNSFKGSYYKAWKLITRIQEWGFKVWAVDHNYDNNYNDTSNPNFKGLFCCSNVYFINTRFLRDFSMSVEM